MGKHSISVGIPVRNGVKWIDDCLRSLEKQTDKDFVTIVVCDSCTDGTEEIVRAFRGKVKELRIIEGRFGNPSKARNAILDEVDTELITFLDSDDLLTRDAIETMKEAPFEEVLCYRKSVVDFETLSRLYDVPSFTPVWLHAKSYRVDFLKGMKIRFDEGLTFNEDVRFNGEVFATLLAANDGWNVVCNSSIVYLQRENKESITHDKRRVSEDEEQREVLFESEPYRRFSGLFGEQHRNITLMYEVSVIRDLIGVSRAYARGARKAHKLPMDLLEVTKVVNVPVIVGVAEQLGVALKTLKTLESIEGEQPKEELTEREKRVTRKVFERFVATLPVSWKEVSSIVSKQLREGV